MYEIKMYLEIICIYIYEYMYKKDLAFDNPQ